MTDIGANISVPMSVVTAPRALSLFTAYQFLNADKGVDAPKNKK